MLPEATQVGWVFGKQGELLLPKFDIGGSGLLPQQASAIVHGARVEDVRAPGGFETRGHLVGHQGGVHVRAEQPPAANQFGAQRAVQVEGNGMVRQRWGQRGLDDGLGLGGVRVTPDLVRGAGHLWPGPEAGVFVELRAALRQ